jgi:tetratricopeptide (TPR) repeat protein
MKAISFLFTIAFCISCSSQHVEGQQQADTTTPVSNQASQDAIIEEHVGKAKKLGLYSRDRQEELDRGLAKDSTIAYLWQQKAMPLFKQGKYELGMKYIDKAVKYDRGRWQDYRAFIKCIFAKTYSDAIADFEDYKARYGHGYVMDHSYDFYIAVSKLQLNEFSDADSLLTAEVARQAEEQGEDWVHHLALFYLGIAKYEQKKYEESIEVFDRALGKYPQFSEALFYKAKALARVGKRDEAIPMYQQAIEYGKQGYSINEDNAIYERYPYQVRWDFYD